MQRSNSTVVTSVGICTSCDEVVDDLALGRGIPIRRTGRLVGGVVEGFGAAPVTGPYPRAFPHERLRDWSKVSRGGNVERGIAGIHVVPDRIEEIGIRILASRGDADRSHRELIVERVEYASDLVKVPRRDDSIQSEQRDILGLIRRFVLLGYGW